MVAEERLRTAPSVAAYAMRRPYVVAPSLEELKGPVSGVVRLPQRLDWSGDPVYDLNKPGNLLAMCQVVLNEATHIDELRQWLNGSALIALWPKLWMWQGSRDELRYRFAAVLAPVAFKPGTQTAAVQIALTAGHRAAPGPQRACGPRRRRGVELRPAGRDDCR